MSYQCRYFYMHCMDPRIQQTVENLREELGIEWGTFDRISVPGGAGNFQALRQYLTQSVDLHGTMEFILTIHDDCGAGVTQEDLLRAREIAGQYPHERIRLFIIHLDGTWTEAL